jgi:DNA-binding GntR family transcriptional regulator
MYYGRLFKQVSERDWDRAGRGAQRPLRVRRMASGAQRLSIARTARNPAGDEVLAPATRPQLEPIDTSFSFKNKAYVALKSAIIGMDVYGSRDEIRLDERGLAEQFGISRTPVREAMAQLEREGFVRSVPRRGIYVVRKSKREVIELITAWAALESMAARLSTQNGSDEEIASLRRMFATFENGEIRAHLDEYSEINIEFHQTIVRLSRNTVLIQLAENLFTHMRMIRRKTIGEKDRADRSIRDHMHIIEALEARDTDRAETLVRDHALGLAEHVAKYADYLE